MQIQPINLIGKRAKLIPTVEEHIEDLFRAGNYAEIWEFTQMKINSLADMKQYVKKVSSSNDTLAFTIIDLDTDMVVGSTRFYDISVQNRSLEIGSTWLTPSVWRTSINTESKYLLLEHCFETLHTIRVQFKTDSRNVRSQSAIERLGASWEGILRNHMILQDGYIRDSVYYSIIDTEWTEVKKRLEKLMLND